jgi:hypothetical protein
MRMRTQVVRSITTVLVAGSALGVVGAEPARAADVVVESVVVEPANPSPATLCQLKVRIKNGGAQTVSMLTFGVKIDGQESSQYKASTYAINVAPGTTGEMALQNFYSPAAPKAFDVQVSLLAAQWVKVTSEGTATTTIPAGAVAGLPTNSTLAIRMAPGK